MMDMAFESLLKTCAPPTQCRVFVYIYIEDLTMKTVGYTRRKEVLNLLCAFSLISCIRMYKRRTELFVYLFCVSTGL